MDTVVAALNAQPTPPYAFAVLTPIGKAQDVFAAAVKSFIRAGDLQHLQYYYNNDVPSPPTAVLKHLIQSHDQDSLRFEVTGDLLFSFWGPVPQNIYIGWQAGRGLLAFDTEPNTENDFRLSEHLDERAQHLAPLHAIFQFDSRNGLLTVVPSNVTQKQVFFQEDRDLYEIFQGRPHILHRKKTLLQFGDLQYQLEYLDPKKIKKSELLTARSNYIQMVTGSPFSPLPGGFDEFWPGSDEPLRDFADVWVKKIIKSSETALVSAAIDKRTEMMVAIKEFTIKDDQEKEDVFREYQIGEMCQGLRGIITPIRFWCSHNCEDARTCAGKWVNGRCRMVIVYPLGYDSFSWSMRKMWSDKPRAWYAICRSTLEGLCNIHAKGYLHSNIDPSHLLVKSLDPPEGAIISLGNMERQGTIQSLKTSDWYRPPEDLEGADVNIDGVTDKADVWCWARAVMSAVGAFEWHPARYSEPQKALTLVRQGKRENKSLLIFQLLEKMLASDPKKRPTAKQAFEHRCWQDDLQDLKD